MAARFSDFAWQSAQRLVDGAGRRTVRRGVCDLMAAGCRIVHNFSGSDYVCLTFDDGPTQHATLDILEALKRHDVPDTFYCVGENVLRYPQLAKAMAEVGHEIGNHTMTHPDLYRLSPRNLSREIEACQRVLRQTCGVQVPTFRAPYGHFR